MTKVIPVKIMAIAKGEGKNRLNKISMDWVIFIFKNKKTALLNHNKAALK